MCYNIYYVNVCEIRWDRNPGPLSFWGREFRNREGIYMFFSIISIVLYFATLFLGITEENAKGKIIAVGTAALALVNFYIICSSGISNHFLVNIIFGALHFCALLIALLMLIPGKPKSEKTKPQESSHYNVTIEDNGKNQYSDIPKAEANDRSGEGDDDADLEYVHFNNVHLSEGMICDVHGEKTDFKIMMRSGGKIYEFYVQDGQTVAYRTEEMIEPKSY